MPRSMREQMILRVAGSVFAGAGYERASMDRIAQLAEVSKPMLYAYFGSKEGLYVAYIERTGADLVDRLVRADQPRAPHAVRLHALTAEFFSFVAEHRDGWTVLYMEMNASRPLAEEVANLRGRIVAEIRRMLEASSESWTGLAPPASDGVAHAIVGAGDSLANWWLKHPEVDRDALVQWYAGLAQATITAAVGLEI
jgi:AcrR family transcriptional regulator